MTTPNSQSNSKEPTFIIEPPKFSWDKPIEDEILTYVRMMKCSWQNMETNSIWGHVRKAAKAYVSAYENVEDHIIREMKLRKEIAEIRDKS